MEEFQELNECKAPTPLPGASRARSGEQSATQGNFVPIAPLDLLCPLDPACKGGIWGARPSQVFDDSLGQISNCLDVPLRGIILFEKSLKFFERRVRTMNSGQWLIRGSVIDDEKHAIL